MRLSATMRRDEGFTLPEMLTSLVLLGFVITAAYLLLNSVTASSDMVQARNQAAEENRHAMEVIATEIRQAVEAIDGYGAFDASMLSATQCTIYSDIDRDGAPEKVSYSLQLGRLMKTVFQNGSAYPPYDFSTTQAGPSTTVCSSVTNTDVFTYLDQQSPPQVVPTSRSKDISAVVIHIVDVARVGQATGTADVATMVKIRSIHSSVQ